MNRRIISVFLVFLLLTSVTIPTVTAEPAMKSTPQGIVTGVIIDQVVNFVGSPEGEQAANYMHEVIKEKKKVDKIVIDTCISKAKEAVDCFLSRPE